MVFLLYFFGGVRGAGGIKQTCFVKKHMLYVLFDMAQCILHRISEEI
jgi:hypothetical protein